MAAHMWKQICLMKTVVYMQTPVKLFAPTWCRLVHHIQKCQASSAELPEMAEVKGDNYTETNYDDDIVEKTIEKTPKAHYKNLKRIPDQPENAEILKLAIIGMPNAGKSTLINRLMGWKVTPVSSKVHTTRKNTNAVLTEGNKQIVFVDTPGLMNATKMKKHRTEKRLVYDPERGVQSADLIAVVVDAADKWNREYLDQKVLKVLHLHKDIPSILILNKTDILRSRLILVHLTGVLTEGIVGGAKIRLAKKSLKREKGNFDVKEYVQKLEEKIIEDGRILNVDDFLQEKKEKLKKAKNQNCSNEDTSLWANSEYKTPVITIKRQNRNQLKDPEDTIENFEDSSESFDTKKDSDFSDITSEEFSNIVKNLMDISENLTNSDDVISEENESEKNLHATEESVQNAELHQNRRFVSAIKEKSISEEQRLYREYIDKIEKVGHEVRDMVGWPCFDRVFMLSALENNGVDMLKDYLLKQTKPGDWMYHSSVLVDENPIEIAKQIVWEKILEHLPKAVPYQVYPSIVLWEEDDEGILNIIMNIKAHDKNQYKLLIGKSGINVKLVSEGAKQELLNAFRCEIRLKLQIKM